jgi:hypothetical protein
MRLHGCDAVREAGVGWGDEEMRSGLRDGKGLA